MLDEICYQRRSALLCHHSCCSCCGSSKSMEELWCIAKDEVEKQIDEGKLKRSHLPFPPTQFEPFIDICPRPQPNCWWWFLYDSSTILRNIILVCDRVSAYVLQHERQKHEPAINKDKKVSEWRKDQNLPMAIRDDSLSWGCVIIQNARPIAA
jgi:hypothetical protein